MPGQFDSVSVGDRIASTVEPHHDRVEGVVIKETSLAFEVEFPPIAGLIPAPWRRVFRRQDGRSVSTRSFTRAFLVESTQGDATRDVIEGAP